MILLVTKRVLSYSDMVIWKCSHLDFILYCISPVPILLTIFLLAIHYPFLSLLWLMYMTLNRWVGTNFTPLSSLLGIIQTFFLEILFLFTENLKWPNYQDWPNMSIFFFSSSELRKKFKGHLGSPLITPVSLLEN